MEYGGLSIIPDGIVVKLLLLVGSLECISPTQVCSVAYTK